MPKKSFDISLKETTALKGLALLLILWHHLFYRETGLYDDIIIAGHGLFHQSGIIAKVCVAIFVLLSGYGLTVQYQNKQLRLKEFFKRRFIKLFTSFWIIWLMFVPIGFVFYDYTLEGVYGNNAYLKLIIQFFGLQNIFKFHGLNSTWWFYTCIIMLYLCFPILNALNRKWLIAATIASLFFMFLPIPYLHPIRFYLIAFIAGMWMAKLKGITLPPPFVKQFNILGCINNRIDSLAISGSYL